MSEANQRVPQPSVPASSSHARESVAGYHEPGFTTWLDGALVSLRLTLVLTLLCGVVFPALLYAGAQLAFPSQADGSLLYDACGRPVGSRLIGQTFASARYFHGRPSAVAYQADNSGGSNMGPANPLLADSLSLRAQGFRSMNTLAPEHPLPADAVTASGSGLDPDISPETANLQIARVARARPGAAMSSVVRLRALVDVHTIPRQGGLLGERRVNVLELNLALDSADGRLPSRANCRTLSEPAHS